MLSRPPTCLPIPHGDGTLFGKPPIGGGKAKKTNNKSTWEEFDVALSRLEKRSGDGVCVRRSRGGAGQRADLSKPEHHARRRLRRRRSCRQHRPSRRPEAHRAAWPDGGGRESRRGGRQYCRQERRRIGTRRLHHPGDDDRARDQRDAASEQGLYDGRFHDRRDRGLKP